MDKFSVLESALTVFLISIITGVITYYVNKSSPIINGNEYLLKMNKLYLSFSFIAFIFSGFFIYAAFFSEEEFNRILIIVSSVMSAIFFYGGTNCLLLYLHHKVNFDDEEVEVTSWVKNTKKLKWKDINKISFSTMSSSLVLHSTKHKVFIHEHIKGYRIFKRLLKEKTGLSLN